MPPGINSQESSNEHRVRHIEHEMVYEIPKLLPGGGGSELLVGGRKSNLIHEESGREVQQLRMKCLEQLLGWLHGQDLHNVHEMIIRANSGMLNRRVRVSPRIDAIRYRRRWRGHFARILVF